MEKSNLDSFLEAKSHDRDLMMFSSEIPCHRYEEQSLQKLTTVLLCHLPVCTFMKKKTPESFIKYLIVTFTLPTSQQYLALTQHFNQHVEISQCLFRLATEE